MDAVDWMESHLHEWSYSNDLDKRMTPETSGATDCSGGVHCAYDRAYGLSIGTWTGDQQHDGEEVWRGESWRDMPWDEMERNDIVLVMVSDDWDFAKYRADAQLYTGTPERTIGCAYGPLPRYFDGRQIDVYNGANRYMVRRVVDNMRPADVWEYNWNGTAKGGNMYNCVNQMYDKIEELEKKVDAISTGGVDKDALAKAVADEICKRMKA